jgi:hypothetical protein
MQEMQQLAVKDGQLEQIVAMIAQKLGIALPPPPAQPAPAPAPAGPSGPPPAAQPPGDGAALLENPVAA